MFKGDVIPTEAQPESPANVAVAFDGVGSGVEGSFVFCSRDNTKDSSTRARRAMCYLSAAREHIAAAQLKCPQGNASLARNDVHLLGYSISAAPYLYRCSNDEKRAAQQNGTASFISGIPLN
jgi:hypothetical protein